MSKDYLATNVLIETLTHNLCRYDSGPKNIDSFTIDQIEKLMKRMEKFLASSQLVPYEGDVPERDKIMACFAQQPDTVRCRFCHESFNAYTAAIEHIQQHDHDLGELNKATSKALHKHEPEQTIGFKENDQGDGGMKQPEKHDQVKDRVENDQKENTPPSTNTANDRAKEQKETESKPKANYMRKRSIPRVGISLSKSMKKFLKKDIDSLVDMALADTDYVKSITDNNWALQHLEECLKPHYPTVKCYPFGSRVVGTGFITSDLDVFVDLQEVYYGRNGKPDVEDILKSIERVAKILDATNQWHVEDIILNARVPLLRVFNREIELQCDLTFSNGLAHRNSLWLQYMFSLQPLSRKLVCYLKKWNPISCLNSYTISLMVIFFFQMHDCLPSVASLQQDPKNDIIIDGWNTGFATPTLDELGLKPPLFELAELVEQFFLFYSLKSCFIEMFSLETQVVSPFFGICWTNAIRKSDFQSPNYSRVPAVMERLKRYMLEHQNDASSKYQFAYNKPLVVQDPFELSHNVAKALPVEVVARTVMMFELCGKLMSEQRRTTARVDENETSPCTP